jgi:hypothetical protein
VAISGARSTPTRAAGASPRPPREARSRETRSGGSGFVLAILGKGTIQPTRRLRPQTSFRSAKGQAGRPSTPPALATRSRDSGERRPPATNASVVGGLAEAATGPSVPPLPSVSAGGHAEAQSRETRSGGFGFVLAILSKGTIQPTRRLRPQTSFRSPRARISRSDGDRSASRREFVAAESPL